MPDNNDAYNAAMWNMAGQLSTQAVNTMNTSRYNKKVEKYNEKWNYQQRDWALEDWHRQNEYNLPKNVRQRMIEGGLNPALMYGKGPGEMVSGPIRSSPSGSPNFQKQQVDLTAGSSIMTYLGVQRQQAELENLQIQNRLLEAKIPNVKANTALTWDKAKFTETQNAQLQQIVSAIDNYAVENPRAPGVNGNYYVEKYEAEINTKNQNLMIAAAENLRRENRNNVSMNLILAQTVHEYTKNMKDKAEIGRINAQVALIQKSGILLQFDIDAAEILNKRFDGPAGKALGAILQRLTK